VCCKTRKLSDSRTASGKGDIRGTEQLMLPLLTFNLWIWWHLSKDILNPGVMIAKVRTDENMMRRQFIF